MKKLVLVVLLLFVIAMPVAAKGNDPVGFRINILAGTPTEADADSPFHIAHGFDFVPNEDKPGRFSFDMDIDGTYYEADFLLVNGAKEDGTQTRLWLFNFPDGLPAGTYTFTGHYYMSCRDAVEDGIYPGPCTTPNEQVEILTPTVDVTFN